MTSEPKIYVVDDDDGARKSACALVSEMAFKVIAFGSAEEFLESYDGYRPGVLLTDYRMLGMTGVELLEKLRAAGVSLSVIVMTAYAETDLTVRAIKSGAVTLLEKPFSGHTLWKAIHQALAEDVKKSADEAAVGRIAERLDGLTAGELAVLRLIVNGQTNKAAAYSLDVSIRTIENRRRSLFEKMHVASIAELVQQVMIARPELC